jgi:hypothetical protein
MKVSTKRILEAGLETARREAEDAARVARAVTWQRRERCRLKRIERELESERKSTGAFNPIRGLFETLRALK